MKILVVDDEPLLLELIALELSMEGHTVLEAGSGNAAVKLLKSTNRSEIDLIICDVAMDDGDGKQVLSYVTSAGLPVKFFFMSGFSEITDQRALELGCDDFLKKPFDPKILADKIRRAFSSPLVEG